MDSIPKASLDQMLATIPSQQSLDMMVSDNHLSKIAKALINWKSVCTNLGISEAEEEAIKEENSKTDARRLAVLRTWRSKHWSLATYRNLAHCFGAEKPDLVEAICQALGAPSGSTMGQQKDPLISPNGVEAASPLFSPNSVMLCSPGGSSAITTSPKEKWSKSAVFICENRQAIKDKFADFQTKVCNKLLKNGVDVEQFRLFVTNQFPPGYCIPPPPANLIEIFKAITQHRLWDYWHYSPLVRIVRIFGAGDPEMKGWIQIYKNDLRSYQLVTTVEDYIEPECDASAAHSSAEKAKDDPRYFTPVEWKTDEAFVNHSLGYLADVWEMFSSHYLLPDSPPTALLERVRKGCVSITWLIPSKLVPQLVKIAKIDTHFFQKHHILKLKVGDRYVHEEDESISAPQVHRKRKLEEDLETDQPPQKRHLVASKDEPSKLGQADYQSTSKTSQHAFDSSSKVLPAESGGYDCEFVDPPPETLETKCPICHDVPRKPKQTDCCGHIFCETCIEPVQTQMKSCPMCNCTDFSTFYDKKLQRALNQLQVRCTYQERGCTWTGGLGKLDSHLNCDDLSSGCEYADIHCKFSYVGCNALMPRKDMIAHMEEEESHHNELLTEEVEEQGREIEELNMKLRMKDEETACTIQQMQEEFTLKLQRKDEEIASVTHKMKEISALLQSKDKEIAEKDKEIAQLKQDTKPTPHLHQVNFCFTMDKFKHHRENDITWYSEPFYTHSRGYKICVRIDANGLRDSNFVSLFTCIMKGEYDDELSWPFHGKITVELLNQKTDDHYAYTLSYNESIGPDYLDYADRVLIGEKNHGWGKTNFISYLKLSEESDSTQYLKDDCLQFQVREVLLYY